MTNSPQKNWKKIYIIMHVGLILFFPAAAFVATLLFHLSFEQVTGPVGLMFLVLILYIGPSLLVLPKLKHKPNLLPSFPDGNYAVLKILNMTTIPLLFFGLSFFISHRLIMCLLFIYGLIFLLISGILRAKVLVRADRMNEAQINL